MISHILFSTQLDQQLLQTQQLPILLVIQKFKDRHSIRNLQSKRVNQIVNHNNIFELSVLNDP